ncbi:RecQ-mediated genome instability protein like [Actinidia chinensis var. chinensis]|uniref:RecQ-mediated genome instability protein 1 n=1 Tax=Actinidia chinensis var. chinensis TaxID=1590841 RepID=A0A2R6QGB1_ACTCC|nr:RecQ-mediated genome instability protein like [Actinidia chinensis var. chinensis]
MSRRRLRLHYSSSEDDDEHQPPPPQEHHHQQQQQEEDDIEFELQESTLNLETVTLTTPNPSPNPNFNPSEHVPLEISDDDDDFIDAADNLFPPSPPPATDQSYQSSFASRVGSSISFENSDCPITGFLGRLGLRLRREWLDSCIAGLESSVPGFGGFDVATKAKLCFEQFLYSDMNYSGGGILPEDMHNMHLVDLDGPFILQVDEIVNISCPLKGRYQNALSGLKRCLKLSMTDGVQRVFGMEYRPIKGLEVLALAGLKVAICNVNIRRGLLMLVPEVFEVLGGQVEDLEAARQRLVHEVNKPPRGKRTRTGVVPPLATRSTLAAWPDSGSAPGHTNIPPSQAEAPRQEADHVVPPSATRATLAAWPPNSVSAPGHTDSPSSQAVNPLRAGAQVVPPSATRATHAAWPPDSVSAPGHTNSPSFQAAAPLQAAEQGRASGISPRERATGDFAVPIRNENAEQDLLPTVVSDVQEIHMVDVDHPVILTGDNEMPFTYLASLSAKQAAMKGTSPNVCGKIKCLLTGVKGFQFKQKTTFELCVYVDDGSLISEILIDHNVNTKRVSDMKERLKQFQVFLANFEGTMLVQISEASPLPIAVEMNQGCPSSDAWSLLRRLQSSNDAQPQQHPHLDPINISP